MPVFRRLTRAADANLGLVAGEELRPIMEQGYTLVQVVGETAQLYLLRDGWELVPAPEEVPAPAGIYRVLAQGTLADLETGLADLDVQQVQEALVAEISYRNRRGAVKMLRQRLADLEEEQAKQLLRGRKVALDAPEAGGQQGKRQADTGAGEAE